MLASTHLFKPQYRPDIDGLRGVAVLAVIGYHAFPGLIAGGFVGVDVFFVVSGFLISTIIFQSLEAGGFSYREFYQRRIRRIFPALLVILIGCTVLGRVILFSDEYAQLGKHTFAGAAFIANFVLWGESSYFDNAAETKPLLHLWSLSIEEQFYLIWPSILYLVWKRRRSFLATTVVIGLASFAINILATSDHPVAAFYWPTSRFWELMAGGVLAYTSYHKREFTPGSGNWISASGLSAIACSVFLVDQTKAFPGWWAVVPVAGTCLVIACPEAWINKNLLGNRVLVGIGLISYPLYLWHWPLLSLARIWDGPTSLLRSTRMGILALSFLAAWLTYRFIERPIRTGRLARPALLLGCLLAAIGIIGANIYAYRGFPDGRRLAYAQVGKWNYWTNETCLKRYPYEKELTGWWFCVSNRDAPPTVVIIGNSFANSLYSGLAGSRRLKDQTILSIGTCEPVKGVLVEQLGMERANPCYGRERQIDHEKFIDEVMTRNPSIRYAILDSWWPEFDASGNYVRRDGTLAGRIAPFERPAEGRAISSLEAYINGLEGRIRFLESRGITPILFLPKPEIDYDVRECFSRPLKSAKRSCTASRDANAAAQERFVAAVRQLQMNHPALALFDPYGVFCEGDLCTFVQHGWPLLRDQAHLSEYGSEIMADRFVRWAESRLPSLLNP